MRFIGFHGTDAGNIDSIVRNGYRLSKEREWFGRGVYFFATYHPLTNGKSEARNWVIFVKNFTDWAVFRAVIETEKYVDLLFDFAHRKLYDRIREEAINRHREAGLADSDFGDHVVFQWMEESLDIDLIRALVNAAKPAWYQSYVVRRPQVQLCVKNCSCIKENIVVERNRRISK